MHLPHGTARDPLHQKVDLRSLLKELGEVRGDVDRRGVVGVRGVGAIALHLAGVVALVALREVAAVLRGVRHVAHVLPLLRHGPGNYHGDVADALDPEGKAVLLLFIYFFNL